MTQPDAKLDSAPVAYLVNQYPMISHTFIRREIQELERQGWHVQRLALRGRRAQLVDPIDLEERTRTAYVLDGWRALRALPAAALTLLATRPRRFARALMLTLRMARGSYRPLLYHLLYLAEACRVTLWLRASGARHLHVHFGTNAVQVAMMVTTLGGPPYSFTIHGPEEFDLFASLGLREKIHQAAFVIAVSDFGRSQLYRWLPHAEWYKVRVVRCGLPADFAAAADGAEENTDTSAGRPAEPLAPPRLVCVGRLCEQKGQLLLLEAVARLHHAGIALHLVLIGDGELREEFSSLRERLGLQDVVHLTGWLSGEQVRQEIRAARALVLPSFAEGLPVALMEAMALQRPVLSTYIAGIPELVTPGDNGWLVPAGDVDALATALTALLATPAEEMRRLGRNGSLQVQRRHSLEREVALLAQCFLQARPALNAPPADATGARRWRVRRPG